MNKHLLRILILLTTTSNVVLAMNKENNTLARPDGFWTPKNESILTEKTSPDHQREDWYQVTNYIAEPWCAISNAGFFITAHVLKNSHPLSAAALTFAGSASAVSHAIPYHSLNVVDRVGAWTAMATVAYDAEIYKMASLSAVLKNPLVLTSLLATGATVLTDHCIAHNEKIIKNISMFTLVNDIATLINNTQPITIKRKSSHKWIHVLWHFLAAWTVYVVLTAYK